MIKGTHNSMSYLPVRKWWMKPMAMFARCQDKTIDEQIKQGCRYYDLRVRFDDETNKFIFAHGLVEYDGCGLFEVLKKLRGASRAKNTNIYIRLMLETFTDASSDQLVLFDSLVSYLKNEFEKEKKLRFRYMIKNPYTMKHDGFYGAKFIEVAEWINKWWELILTPRFFTKKQNKKIEELRKSKFKGIVAQDFI